jgi:hypothetical protein
MCDQCAVLAAELDATRDQLVAAEHALRDIAAERARLVMALEEAERLQAIDVMVDNFMRVYGGRDANGACLPAQEADRE